MIRTGLAIWMVVALTCPARSQDNSYRVLPRDFNEDKSQQMMRSHLRAQVHAVLDRRLGELQSALESPENLALYQGRRREFLKRTLHFENPTPLRPQVTGTIQAETYAIEKVLFQSLPHFYVTANLYRPKGKGPFPAILHPVGHSENGKASDTYQRANLLLVQHGFIVLCFDPIGQGERKQILGKQGNAAYRASSEHQQLGVAPILLGRSLGAYMVNDAVRAIDYLCSRDDVDPQRIGCTGNSGGGNLTSFLMAYDDRIAAAAPGCFMTTHRRKNESPGPGDAEQNLFAQIGAGFDHPDFILARAPKPTLILAATKDFVPIAGTWEAFRQAKRVYTQLGHPERIELIEANEKHGFTRRLREGAVRFFARWLQSRHIEVVETQVPTHAEASLQVTPTGQVLQLDGARSILDHYAEHEQELAGRRPPLTRDVVRQLTGIRPLQSLPAARVERRPLVKSNAAPIQLVIQPERGIMLPALHWPDGQAEPVLLAPADGMNSVVDKAKRLNAEGHPVLIVEVRDTGETKTKNWRFFGADYYVAYMLGQCWLGKRAEDLLVSARWLRKRSSNRAQTVRILADGEIGSAALHASALEPTLISTTTVTNGLETWASLMQATDGHSKIHEAVHGALAYYDLPDLKTLRR